MDPKLETKRLEAAIAATDEVCPPDYLENTLRGRDLVGGKGSRAANKLSRAVLLKVAWTQRAPRPGDIPGCTYWETPLWGYEGIKALEALREDEVVICDDFKGTGDVTLTVEREIGRATKKCVLILGPEAGREVIFTVVFGDTPEGMMVTGKGLVHGRGLTVAEAKAYGFRYAKII